MNNQWQSELAGYLFGEGCIGIYKYHTYRASGKNMRGKPRKIRLYRAIVAVSARADDATSLYFFQEKFGGYIYKRKEQPQSGGYISKPSVYWKVSRNDKVAEIVSILEKAQMPSKKKLLLPTMREYLKLADGSRYSDDQKTRIEAIIEEQKKIRGYC